LSRTVTVNWRVGALFKKGLPHARRDQNAAQGTVTRGDPFGKGHNVWLQLITRRGKHLASAAKTGDDFVGDEKNVVLAAETLNFFKVAFMRRVHPARSHDGLGNVSRDVLRPQALDYRRERTRVMFADAFGAINQRIGAVALAVEIQAGHTGAVGM